MRELGHEVYGVVRTDDPEVTAPLAGYGVADLAEPQLIASALHDLAESLPRLDGLVHSAGIARPGGLARTDSTDLTDQFTVNVTAVAALDQVFLPALRAVGGTLVYVNSGSGLAGRPAFGSYAASKFALRGYADSLRLEEPEVRVSSIYPGRVATDMQAELQSAEGADYDPGAFLQVGTVGRLIVDLLTLPAEGVVTDLTISLR